MTESTEIAYGEYVSGKVLDWAGCGDLWSDHQLGARFDVVRDVLGKCVAVDIETEEYDFRLPGASGIRYRVTTEEPALLKVEIR